MARISLRWAALFRWLRRPDVVGAFVAIAFVLVLLSAGLYALITMHGFRLAGG